VSSDGGNLALWSATRNEIYFAGNQQQRLMVAPFTIAGNVFTPAKACSTNFGGRPAAESCCLIV
jgi:hypothetical protein